MWRAGAVRTLWRAVSSVWDQWETINLRAALSAASAQESVLDAGDGRCVKHVLFPFKELGV